MTEWRESDTFCECTIHCRTMVLELEDERHHLALVQKDQLLIVLKATEVQQLLSKLQKNPYQIPQGR